MLVVEVEVAVKETYQEDKKRERDRKNEYADMILVNVFTPNKQTPARFSTYSTKPALNIDLKSKLSSICKFTSNEY